MHDQQYDAFDIEANGLELTSSAFSDGGELPVDYTCDGDGKNPPFTVQGVDENARSLVLIAEDPDAPIGTFDHWIVYNLDPTTTEIKAGSEPDAHLGVNTAGEVGWYPACPPGERHRYIFTLYSLDATLSVEEGAKKERVIEAMQGHTLQKSQLISYYERS